MKIKRRPDTFRRPASEVREIAKGIFDHDERRTVLRLVDEYVRLSKAAAALR